MVTCNNDLIHEVTVAHHSSGKRVAFYNNVPGLFQMFIDLRDIKKCNTKKGGLFVLQEYG